MSVFVRRESFRLFAKLYPVTLSFIFLSLAVYIGMVATGSTSSAGHLYQFGAFYADSVKEGQWFRFVTAIFVHLGFLHLLMNALFLYVFGPHLERVLGKWKFTLFFLATGICSFILPFFLSPHLVAGMSGSIYGLFGMYVYLMWYHVHYIPHKQDQQTVIVMIVFGLAMTLLNPSSSLLGHVGGLVGGFLLSPLFFIQKAKK